MAQRAFIIGGTGQIGRAIGARLLADGWDVILSSRGERDRPDELIAQGATMAQLDRNRPGQLARALHDGADAVIDTIAYDREHADQLLDLAGKVGQFLIISSASVYRDEQGRTLDEAAVNGFPEMPDPMTETQPTVAPGPETYSTRKIALEQRLLDSAGPPATILRPCAIHGTHSSHPREWWFVKRMRDGRHAIPLCLGGRSRFHTTAVANIAELVAVALARPDKRILNVGDPVALPVAEIGALIATAMDWDGEFLPFDADNDPGAPGGRTPWSVPAPFTISSEAAHAIGYVPVIDYARSVPALCEWLRSQPTEGWEQRFQTLAAYPRPHFDYAAEDVFLRVAI